MVNMYSHNNISFQAKIGNNALKTVKNECYSDKRVAKFKQLFEDTFAKNIDENTVVDFDKNNNYICPSEVCCKICIWKNHIINHLSVY